MDIFTAVLICEGSEEATEDEKVSAWQLLIDTGLAWQLQGFFGRTARYLIENGTCMRAAA